MRNARLDRNDASASNRSSRSELPAVRSTHRKFASIASVDDPFFLRNNRKRMMGLMAHRFSPPVMGMLLLLSVAGCGTMPPLPPANLKEPGWVVRHGQAVWRLPKGKPDIAGELIVATRDRNQSFVQFSKNPFTLVTAQATADGWAVQFPPENKHYSGRRAPPLRLIWLYLPRVLTGEPPPKNWSWHMDTNGWRLENYKNGESLEGYFDP
jgi:hypothetical protein